MSQLDKIWLAVCGISAGLIVACGLGAFITMIGVITRMAWKSKTMKKIPIYENSMMTGAVVADYLYLSMPGFHLSQTVSFLLLGFVGLLMGIYVGCVAMSLAEALDASAVLFRRIKFTGSSKYVLLAAAFGKLVGNILYFWRIY